MLAPLDRLLRTLLVTEVSGLAATPATVPGPAPPVTEDQIRFQPPDEQWRKDVDNLQRNAVSVFLIDVRENRKLRSNERTRVVDRGVLVDIPAPARLDCHYLISVQSPAVISVQIEPTLDEHDLLYEIAAVLMRHAPLNPARVYGPGAPSLQAWPERFREVDLPVVIGPPEGFPKLAEFWGTMGVHHRWKPALYVIVTLPVDLVAEPVAPLVTTRIAEYRVTGQPDSAEVLIKIGGRVIDNAGPVPKAWVQLESSGGAALRHTSTDDGGRYTFDRLRPGRYQLRWRAGARPEPPVRLVDVPSPSGEYDLSFP